MSLTLIAAAVSVCAASAEPQCGYDHLNMVVNGSFDTFDSTGWTLECSDGGCGVEPESSADSGQFRRTVLEGFYAKLSQQIYLKPGRYAFEFSVRDSTIVPQFQYNSSYFRIGSLSGSFLQDGPDFSEYREFVSGGGATELSFEWLTYYRTEHQVQSIVLDDIVLIQIDDDSAAQSTTLSLAASLDNVQRFIDTMFGAQGTGPVSLAARPVATSVAGPAMMRSAKTRAWASAAYSDANWNEFNAHSRDSSVSGGVETDAGGGWAAGFAGHVADREGKFTSAVSETASSGRSASFAIYGAFAPKSEAYFVRSAVGGGFSSRDHERTRFLTSGPAVADDVDGLHWFATVEAGYGFEAIPSVLLTPYARVTFAGAREAAYVEVDSGCCADPILVDRAEQDSLSSQIGLRGGFTGVVDPSITIGFHGAWRHEFLDANGVAATYLDITGMNVTLLTPGLSQGRDSAIFGADIEVALWDQTSLFVRYDGEAGSGFNVNSGQAGLRAIW